MRQETPPPPPRTGPAPRLTGFAQAPVPPLQRGPVNAEDPTDAQFRRWREAADRSIHRGVPARARPRGARLVRLILLVAVLLAGLAAIASLL